MSYYNLSKYYPKQKVGMKNNSSDGLKKNRAKEFIFPKDILLFSLSGTCIHKVVHIYFLNFFFFFFFIAGPLDRILPGMEFKAPAVKAQSPNR